ncbi:MAG: phosphate/phosphite/phosphonate ABC transporter substrate-binding protein [Pseudomonadales bacterium]
MLYRLCFLLVFSASAIADNCPRGDLDERYCDADGDLVADLPARHLVPRTLIFAYTPVEDPAIYRDVWSEFLTHLEAVTGRRVVFFPVQSNAAQIEAMRSGRLHVAGFNTGSTPLAVNCAGFVPVAMMASADDSFGYEMELITHRDSGIDSAEDIRGKVVAFTSPTSNSGFKAPTAILESEYGLIGSEDYTHTFSGKHDNTILGVVNKDYAVGAIASSVKKRMIARGVIDPGVLKVLYRSQTFPTTAFGHVYNLDPNLAAKVRQAFATFDWTGTKLAEEFLKSGEEKFLSIDYKTYWEVIRNIDRANNVSYACR